MNLYEYNFIAETLVKIMHFTMNSFVIVLFVLHTLYLDLFSAFNERTNVNRPSASLFDMVQMLETELKLIDNAEKYAAQLQNKVNVLKK